LTIVLVIAGIAAYSVIQYLQPSNPNPTPPLPTEQPSQPQQSNQPSTSPSTSGIGVIKVTAGDLSSEYSSNVVAADLKYKEKVLQVSGTIYKIGRVPAGSADYSDKAYITLSTNSYSKEGVLVFFKDESVIAKIHTGEGIIVEGKCVGSSKILETANVILLDSSSVERAEFKLTGWHISVQSRQAPFSFSGPSIIYLTYLSIYFTKFGYGISLTLDGVGGYVLTAEEEDGARDFVISTENGVPEPGQHKLVAKDSKGNIIVTETFNFVGAKIVISNVSVYTTLGRQYGYPQEGIYLTNIILNMKNDGDLPFIAGALEVSTSEGTQTKSYNFQPVAVLSGEEKIVAAAQQYGDNTLRFASSGEKTIVLNFKDGWGKVVYSYSTTITV
jgi:hypothetical protein